MTLLPFFEWAETSLIGNTIRDSLWLFPVIESVHLIALALIGGALLVVDLRLLGFGLRNYPAREIAREAQPWLVGALAVMIATGVPLFLSESVKCYYSSAFWVKMTTLPIALLFTFTIRRKVAAAESIGRAWSGLVGLVSILLWFGVAAAGRWIGFS
jgi:hypothetical protein